LSIGTISNVWSWGFGWKLGGARVDYSMGVPLTGVTRFTHGLTVAIRFGRSDPQAEYEGLLQNEMKARQQLGRSLDASAVRQQALSEEIGRLRDEIAALRASLAEKTSTAADARKKLNDLEARQKKAAEAFARLQDEQARNAAKTKAELFNEEWASYEKSKLGGAPDAALLQRVQRLLVEYKDSGVDLGEANQELRRLQQSR
jgi:septal ring factor EnvC (AmiA/AmiB activator)